MDLAEAERRANAVVSNTGRNFKLSDVHIESTSPNFHELVMKFTAAVKIENGRSPTPARVAYETFDAANHVRNVLQGHTPSVLAKEATVLEFIGK